jgi:hypothetical protein
MDCMAISSAHQGHVLASISFPPPWCLVSRQPFGFLTLYPVVRANCQLVRFGERLFPKGVGFADLEPRQRVACCVGPRQESRFSDWRIFRLRSRLIAAAISKRLGRA